MASVRLKIVDGMVKYKLLTFDGSCVDGVMHEDEAKTFIASAEEKCDVPGYELASGPYRFQTEEVVMTLKGKKRQEDEE